MPELNAARYEAIQQTQFGHSLSNLFLIHARMTEVEFLKPLKPSCLQCLGQGPLANRLPVLFLVVPIDLPGDIQSFVISAAARF